MYYPQQLVDFDVLVVVDSLKKNVVVVVVVVVDLLLLLLDGVDGQHTAAAVLEDELAADHQ